MSEENQSVESTTAETSVSANKNKKNGWVVWVVIALLALAGAYIALDRYGLLDKNQEDSGTEVGDVDVDTVVATVNGATITRGDLNEKIEQVRRSLPAGTPDPTEDASFELQLLDDLINLELLISAAGEMNYTVSDDEIEAEKTILIEQFGGEEAFTQQLEMLGITTEELNDNMRNELLIRQLLEDKTDIDGVEVTDEEIQNTYDMAVGDAEDAPPLEQVEELIRSELLNQKTAEIVEAYINELRVNAKIEKTL